MPPPLTTLDHLRGVALALVVGISCYLAAPIPSSVKRSTLDNPIALEELQRWSGILGSVGIAITPDELKDQVFERTQKLTELRRASLKPIRPFTRLTGTGQSWGVFTYPNSFPHILHIDLLTGGEWEPLYIPLDPEHDWNKQLFVYRRVRGVYDDNATAPRSSYDHFVDWIGTMALEQHPQAAAVQFYYVRSHVTLPNEDSDPKTTQKNRRRRSRHALGLE